MVGAVGKPNVWKVLGLAGIAGVVAAGVVVARSERRRRAYSADDVRARLHARLAEAAPPGPAAAGAVGADAGRRWWEGLRSPRAGRRSW
jgi:hypothetical protein